MDILGAFLAAIACFLLVRHLSRRKNYIRKHKVAAENAFRALSVAAADPRFSFDGGMAQVMDDREEVEEMGGALLAYVQTKISRNESGEYFWFHFRTDSPPLFKHIDQGRAKVMLRGKYIAPSVRAHAHSGLEE